MNDTESVKVYIADVSILNDPFWYEKAYHMVPKERREKADRYRFPKDRILSLGAGLLLRYALKGAGIGLAETAVTDKGKPYIKDHSERFCSLSHSGTIAMCAAAKVPVGCDVQEVKEPPLSASHLVFSKEERAYLSGMNGEFQKDCFFALWTGKESFLKMTGEGLSGNPDGFTIKLPFGMQKIREKMVTFYDVPCNTGYRAAVCAEGNHQSEELSAEKVDLRKVMEWLLK